MCSLGSPFPLELMKLLSLCLTAFAFAVTFDGTAAEQRALPRPSRIHPGNVFLAGEDVIVELPKNDGRWSLLDYDGKELTALSEQEGKTSLGKLPVGCYRFRSTDTNQWISLAVIEPLSAPTPSASPIGIDVAMAWFYGPERMDAVANLCALAGMNWVRDRLHWGEMEPQRGQFSPPNKYDASAAAQSRAGLRVPQVIHLSPSWANSNGKRFPLDLRDSHRFFKEMAQRWRGQVQAFEPWNEADIPMFGGHTGAEMASFQKAAYLGIKAGNPEVIACLNVFALHNPNQLADLNENEAWPYFDTYNLHHYEPFDNYPKLYAEHRAVSAGKPLWVSECAVPVKWAGDAQLQEPSEADLRVQAERVAKTFACSLHEGSAATFYFLFPHYVEGQTQFGILRPDLTPRPAYVALAAVGRLLADAKPLGRLNHTNVDVRAYWFSARPDGREREVLVAWAAKGACELELGSTLQAEAVFDPLGRRAATTTRLPLTSGPIFVVFAKGSARHLPLAPPAATPEKHADKPSPVVLQALWPGDQIDLNRSALRLPTTDPASIPVFAYNFSAESARGDLRVSAPAGWHVTLPADLQIAPGERKEFALKIQAGDHRTPATLRIHGDFGRLGKAVLSLRLVSEPMP
jgi:hypothetical protein